MTIVNKILKQMPAVGPPPRTVLVMVVSTSRARRGRVNFRHLSRDGDDSERTSARQFRRSCDGPDFPQRVITTALDPQATVISAQEAACLPKRGKQPCGLGHFFNGGAGRAERGLEIATLAVVAVTHRCAVTLAVAQTPPTCATAAKPDQEASRGDGYTQQRRAPQHRLPAWGTDPAGDGDFATQPSIAAVVDRRRHPITTRRGAADGRFLFTGPHPPRRGAHRTDDGKVPWPDVSRVEALGTLAEAEQVHLYPAGVWPVTLTRKLRVVVLINRKDPAPPRDLVRASTARALDGHQRLEWYGARFQLECWCRASTPFTGLTACQARAAAPLSCHGNAARATRTLVRAADLNAQPGAEPRVFSRASWQPCPFHERWLDVLIET